MTDGADSAGSDVATAHDLNDRIAALRERMALLEESISGDAKAQPRAQTHESAASAQATTDTEAAPVRDESTETVAEPPRVLKPRPKPERVKRTEPAPGVDPDDPVLALGVADPDALDAWLTDEIAVVDPNATGEMDPVTAEMDAITKPSVYDTLAPDDKQERRWSAPPRDDVTVEAVPQVDEPYDGIGSRHWLTLLVVAAVLIGMAVAVALWLAAQPDSAEGIILLPFL